MVLDRLLTVPWAARSNQSILKEINPVYPLAGVMLKLEYSGHLIVLSVTRSVVPNSL